MMILSDCYDHSLKGYSSHLMIVDYLRNLPEETGIDVDQVNFNDTKQLDDTAVSLWNKTVKMMNALPSSDVHAEGIRLHRQVIARGIRSWRLMMRMAMCSSFLKVRDSAVALFEILCEGTQSPAGNLDFCSKQLNLLLKPFVSVSCAQDGCSTLEDGCFNVW